MHDPAAAPLLLDTCAALWLLGQEPLSEAASAAISSALSADVGVYLSPFTAWEIGTLVAKGRLQLTMTPVIWFDTILALPGIRLAELTPQILLHSTSLPGNPPNDPADRIIAATARTYGLPVLTRDRLLIAYAKSGHIQVIPC